MATCFAAPAKLSHPAQYTYLAAPQQNHNAPTITTATTTLSTAARRASTRHTPASQVAHYVPSYATLRAHHAYALKQVISQLRWDQTNNLYLPGHDAIWNLDQIISLLEKELQGVEEAQKGLDKFPNCFAPVWFPESHGPQTKDEDQRISKMEEEREKLMEVKLEQHFPFLKQLFIGPMTKQQARNDRLLKQQLRDGYSQEVFELLPSANARVLMDQYEQKVNAPKKNYQKRRMEKERAKIAAYLEVRPQEDKAREAEEPPRKVSGAPPQGRRQFGPLTKDQYTASLPMYGPLTKDHTLHEVQRKQRQVILGWLHKPWNKYDQEAAGLIEKMAEVARGRLENKKVQERLEGAEVAEVKK